MLNYPILCILYTAFVSHFNFRNNLLQYLKIYILWENLQNSQIGIPQNVFGKRIFWGIEIMSSRISEQFFFENLQNSQIRIPIFFGNRNNFIAGFENKNYILRIFEK